MNKYRIVILLLLISSFINAQSDVGLWTSFSVEKPVSRSFSLNYSEELRFANSSVNLNNIRSSLAVSYMISKKTEASVEYLMISKSYVNYFANKNRLSFDIQYKDKLNKWRYSTELRYAWQDKNLFLTDEDGYFPQPFVRWAAEIKRSVVKSLTASIKYQLYLSAYNSFEMDKQRLALGFEYKINKANSVGITGYLQQSDTSQKTWILSAEYKIKI